MRKSEFSQFKRFLLNGIESGKKKPAGGKRAGHVRMAVGRLR